jgi:predicted ribosomally synthesized peptide with SipW-like signal peptide
MKSIFLSVVIICALAIAGVGGTFATWSDSETSMDNSIVTGSVDLKVNGADDAPWGAGVPSKVDITCMIPAKWYGPYEVELWNAGQCTQASHAYINFKDLCCGNALPKVNPYPDGGSAYWPANTTTGYVCPVTGDLKPEPELVAEQGGKVDCLTVPGVGVQGDTCTMKSHVKCMVTADKEGEKVIIEPTKLINLEGLETYLFDLKPCNARTIYLWFYLVQESEEDYGYNFFKSPEELGLKEGDPGYAEALLRWSKFNDWPSWSLMKDMVTFSIEFDLWLEDP